MGNTVLQGQQRKEKGETPHRLRVLLAEDNPADVLLMREALTGSFPDAEISVSEDGEIMMHRIDLVDSGEEPLPDVILLDLNMPRANGDELLWRLRDSPRCQGVPTVIVTSSDSPRDRSRAAKLGAVRYFHKPIDYAAFMHLGAVVKDLVESH